MRIGIVFPGQGSHRPGAASAWADHPAHATFAEIGAVCGLDLAAAAEAEDTGASTALAQPTIFAASLAAYRAVTDLGVEPAVVAGHSLGEVTAAVAAGVFSVRDGAELVAERGRAMAAACAACPGTMAAILRLDDQQLAELVRRVPDATIANENAPGQTVVSGPPHAIDRVVELVGEAGGRARRLDVEGAFHSPAMAPALVRVDTVLKRLPTSQPRVPLVTGTSGEVLRSDVAIRRALVDGILAPVRWRAVQERLADLDLDLVVEVGPGGVLRGLARRALPDLPFLTVEAPADLDALTDQLVVTTGAAR